MRPVSPGLRTKLLTFILGLPADEREEMAILLTGQGAALPPSPEPSAPAALVWAEERRATLIDWADATWNPVTGCSAVSPGCTNCYAIRHANRMQGRVQAYRGTVRRSGDRLVWTGKLNLNRAALAKPRKLAAKGECWTIFVNSMSDAFHEDIPDEWRDLIFEQIAAVTGHRYLILTKRPEVARRYFEVHPRYASLPQVWIGVTVEGADHRARLDILRDIPARTRFVSAEPLLGNLHLRRRDLHRIDWVITGGESGPRSRPCSADWVRAVRDIAKEAGAAYFHKQWGQWENNPLVREVGLDRAKEIEAEAARAIADTKHVPSGGHLLDGRVWMEWPAAKEGG